jgi:hypothetical protein
MALTARQQAFVREYLVGRNAAAAARRAGYSPRTARQQGQRLLTNVDIRGAIDAATEQQAKRNGITADLILQGLLREAQHTGEGSGHSARVRAWMALAKLIGLEDAKFRELEAEFKALEAAFDAYQHAQRGGGS